MHFGNPTQQSILTTERPPSFFSATEKAFWNLENELTAVEQSLDARRREASVLIHAFAVTQGAVAFVLANTALVDSPILAGITMWMIHKLGKVFGKQNVDGPQIFWNIFQYIAGGWVAAKLLFFVPGLGNWANAAAIMLITETIGWACIHIFSQNLDPSTMTKEQWKRIIKTAKKEGKKHNEENKQVLKKATDEERKRLRTLGDQLRDESLSEDEKEASLASLANLYEDIRTR